MPGKKKRKFKEPSSLDERILTIALTELMVRTGNEAFVVQRADFEALNAKRGLAALSIKNTEVGMTVQLHWLGNDVVH